MNEKKPLKKPVCKDWHRADIKAALEKAGWTLRRLSRHHGYKSPGTLTKALDGPWPKGERIIAAAIGIDPETLWPSRYLKKRTPGRAGRSDSRGVKAA